MDPKCQMLLNHFALYIRMSSCNSNRLIFDFLFCGSDVVIHKVLEPTMKDTIGINLILFFYTIFIKSHLFLELILFLSFFLSFLNLFVLTNFSQI